MAAEVACETPGRLRTTSFEKARCRQDERKEKGAELQKRKQDDGKAGGRKGENQNKDSRAAEETNKDKVEVVSTAPATPSKRAAS